MENYDKLWLACEKHGKTGLARRLNIPVQTIFKALRERRGLRPEKMLEIDKLLTDDNQQTIQEPLAPAGDMTQIERLILDNVQRLPEQAQAQVLAYVIQLAQEPK